MFDFYLGCDIEIAEDELEIQEMLGYLSANEILAEMEKKHE